MGLRGFALTSPAVIYQFYSPLTNTTLPMALDVNFLFTDEGKIQQYDSTVRNAAWFGAAIQNAAGAQLTGEFASNDCC